MKIDMRQEDFGTLCLCAIRYCHGRMTYMPGLVQSIVKRHLSELSDKDIGVMVQDCEFQAKMNMYGDERIDKPGWLEFERLVREEAKRRGADETH